MKKFIISLAAASAVFAASAQSVFNNPDNRPYWGIRASLDVNFPSDWSFDNGNSAKMFRTGAGGSVGGVFNLPIVANFYFEPGVSLFYDTYRFDGLIVSGESYESHDPQVRKFGVRVPLMLGYRFDVSPRASLAVYTGPELSYSLWGEIEKDSDITDDDDFYKLFDTHGQRRANVSWCVGASLEWDYHWMLGLTGAFGLNDLQRNDAKFHENRLSITLGYNF